MERLNKTAGTLNYQKDAFGATAAETGALDTPLVDCIVNWHTPPITSPADKARIGSADDADTRYRWHYAHRNWTAAQLPLRDFLEITYLRGYHVVPGRFEKTQAGQKWELKSAKAWRAQQVFFIEFDNVDEKTIAEFVKNRPFVARHAWAVVGSVRDAYDDPGDNTCNGERRLRLAFVLPQPVETLEERHWICDALLKELPGCDTSANSPHAGGIGAKDADSLSIGNIVSEAWYREALAAGKRQKEQKAREAAAAAKEREQRRKQFGEKTGRTGDLPCVALAQADPDDYLRACGLALKRTRPDGIQVWGRPDKPNDTALTVTTNGTETCVIRIYAASLQLPQGTYAWPRFYCLREFGVDIKGLSPRSQPWKTLQADLAARGFGTWKTEAEFQAERRKENQGDSPQGRKSSASLNPLRAGTPANRKGELFIGKPPVASIGYLPEDSPIYAQAAAARGPSFRYFSREERMLIRAIGLNPDAGWSPDGTPDWIPKYEQLHAATGHFARNGHPAEVEKRRIWYSLFKTCPDCGGVAAVAIVRYELQAVRYCETCHKETRLTSYAELEWQRKPANTIQSTFQGYIAEDPALKTLPLGEPGIITHLGAPMGSGKTYAYENCIAPAIRARYPGITFVVVCARVTQVIAKYSEACQTGAALAPAEIGTPHARLKDVDTDNVNIGLRSETDLLQKPLSNALRTTAAVRVGESDSTLAEDVLFHPRKNTARTAEKKWGAFCQQTTADDKFIGTDGAITTPNSLPQVVAAIAKSVKDPRAIHLCFDETDFDMSLLNAPISKTQARELKNIIRSSIARYGAVTMGQTEQTATLEAFAAEFDVPKENIVGYFKTGNRQSATCHLYEVPDAAGKINTQIAAAWELIQDRLANGIPCYVFCKRRRTAKALATLRRDALLYDRYHRGCNANQALIHKQRSRAMLTVFTPTVDVALNIKHEGSAVFVLTDENPRTGAGMDTTVQQTMRVRDAAEYHLFIARYHNARPIAPTEREAYEEAYARTRLGIDEACPSSLLKHVSRREALRELNGNEPVAYVTHHLQQVGFDVLVETCPVPKAATIAQIQDITKAQRAAEKAAVTARAGELIETETVMASVDIQKQGSQWKLPVPPGSEHAIEHRAHETALAASLAVGFEPMKAQEKREERQRNQQHAAERARRNDEGDDGDTGIFHTLDTGQKASALAFVNAEINPDAFRRWRSGYLGTHYPHLAAKEWKEARQKDEEVLHRPDANRIGACVKSLLQAVPRGSVSETDWGEAVVTALEAHAKSLKDGALSAATARQVRFIDMTTPNPALSEWAGKFLQDNYPCRVSVRVVPNAEKDADGRTRRVFQLLQHRDIAVIERCIQDELAFGRHANEDLTKLYPHLAPSDIEREELDADAKATARAMKAAGKTREQIREATGLSLDTLTKATSGVKKGKNLSPLQAHLLALLADGKAWKRKEIDKAADAAKQNITAALRALCERGAIQKPRHGMYRISKNMHAKRQLKNK